MINRTILLASSFALLAGAAPLTAQRLTVRLAAGSVISSTTTGGAGENHRAGPAAMISIESPLPERPYIRGSVRLDGEWSRLNGRAAPTGFDSDPQYADVQVFGASLNFVVALTGRPVEPYLITGIGAYRLQKANQPRNPNGTTAAVQTGLGIDLSLWKRVNAFAEARLMLHATGYAAAAELTPTSYSPVLIGVRINSASFDAAQVRS